MDFIAKIILPKSVNLIHVILNTVADEKKQLENAQLEAERRRLAELERKAAEERARARAKVEEERRKEKLARELERKLEEEKKKLKKL